MRRFFYTLLLLLAACGGGADRREYGPGVDVLREQPLGLDLAGTFSRASPGYVMDWEGVWLPLDIDEPGYTGARRVKNLYLHSDTPAQWQHVVVTNDNTMAIDGDGIVIHHAEGQRGSPYLCNEVETDEPGNQAPSLFASRAEVQVLAGPTLDKWSPVGRTGGVAIGSESNNPGLTLDLAAPRVLSQTAQQFERHQGWCQTYLSHTTVARSYRVRQVQFEDLSGAKTPVSGEYCPSADKPGICWHATARNTSRPGYVFDSFDSAGIVWSGGGGGVLTEAASPARLAGELTLQLEPASTNRALHNTLAGLVGTAVLDGASTTHTGEAPAPLGGTSLWTDPRSERLVYNKADLTLAQDGITSTNTNLAVFPAGAWIWLHVPTLGAVGPVQVAEAGPRYLRVLQALPSVPAGQRIGLQRVPGVGDAIIVGLNGGRYHYSTVTGLQLPTLPTGLLPAQLLHQSVRIDIADPLPWAGGAAGANGNLPVYWHRPADVPVSIARGTGASARIVRDDSVIGAGLGYLLRARLVLELTAGRDYALFDLAGVPGERKVLTTASAWARTVSGKAGTLSLQAHSGGALIGTTWERLAHTTTNVNGTGSVRVLVPAGAVVRVAVPQVEPLGWASSPIVTGPDPALRALASLSNPATTTLPKPGTTGLFSD